MSNSASGKVEITIRIDGQNNAGTAIAQTNAQLESLEKRAEGVAVAAAKQTKELDAQIAAITKQQGALKSLGMANGPAFQANYDKLVSLNKQRVTLINAEIVGLQRELVVMKELGAAEGPIAQAHREQIDLLARKRSEYERLAQAAGRANDAQSGSKVSISVPQSGGGFLGLGKGGLDGLTAMAGKANILLQAAEAAKQKLGEVFEAVEAGASKADRFDALKGSIAGFEGLLSRAKKATAGMIPEAELTKAIALFDSFGLPLEQFDRVLQQASKTALRTGEDVTQMVDSLVRGVARGSPQILDNLGIIVSMDEVTKRATQSTGKMADALSDQDKKAALLALSLEELEKKNVNVNLTDSRTAAVKRLSTAWQDFKDGAEQFLANAANAVIGFFDKLFDSTSEAERAIQRMSEQLPSSLANFRNAAEAELGAVTKAFNQAKSSADLFMNTFNRYSANAEEKGKLEAAVEKMKAEEASKYEAKIAQLRESYKDDGWMGGARKAKQLEIESAKAADEMVANIQRRTEALQRGFDLMVDSRVKTDKDLESIDADYIARKKQQDAEERSRMDPLKAQIQEYEESIEALEKARSKARTERNTKELREIGDKLLSQRAYLDELKKADEYESKKDRGGGRSPKRETRETRKEEKTIEIAPIEREKYYNETLDKRDYAGQMLDAQRKAKAQIENVERYRTDILAAMREPDLGDREIARLSKMYRDAADAKLAIERELDAELRRLGHDREEYLAARREERLEKDKKAAAEEKAKNFDTANKAIKAADSVLSTFIKNDKALAIARIPLALAEAGLAGARQDYFGMAMGFFSAAQFGIVAASGSGKRGASGNRSGPVRPTAGPREREESTAPNVFNLFGGMLFGTPGELGAKVTGVVRVAQANGFASGAI